MTLSARQKNFGLFQHYINMGFEKGVSDIFIFNSGKTFVIELKAPGGKLSPSQVGFITRLEREKIPVVVMDNYYNVIDQLFKWEVIKKMPLI